MRLEAKIIEYTPDGRVLSRYVNAKYKGGLIVTFYGAWYICNEEWLRTDRYIWYPINKPESITLRPVSVLVMASDISGADIKEFLLVRKKKWWEL